MKYSILVAFLCSFSVCYSQSNNNPTIAICNGNQYICATDVMLQICVTIKVEPSYPNISVIDKFEIDWGDGSPKTTVTGSTNPANIS